MTKRITAKTLALFFAFLILCLPLSACNSKKDLPVTTVVMEDGSQKELPLVTMWVDVPNLGTMEVNELLRGVPGQNTEFHVEYEYVNGYFSSSDQDAQNNRITRLRIEIMAGEGPDLFLCDSLRRVENVDGDRKVTVYERTFPFPQRLMENNTFLVLDEYIENAQYMEWDKLNPVIMEAGKTDKGQMLLPVTFDFQVGIYDKSCLDKTYELPMTYQEMIDSGDPILMSAAMPLPYWLPMTKTETDQLDDMNLGANGALSQLLDVFGQPADFKKQDLLFTEEEFTKVVKDAWNMQQRKDEILPSSDINYISSPFLSFSNYAESNDFRHDESYLILPRYNNQGGITATIGAYGAVNANASYPEYAFRVLDCLLSKDMQKNSGTLAAISGFPVYMGLGDSMENGVHSTMAETWFMTEEHYKQYEALLGQINAVKFETRLDIEANVDLWQRYRDNGYTEKALDDSIKTAYKTMQMMLAES